MLKLIIKSLIYYRQRYFWAFAGLVLASAILNGALTVGSSVKESLREIAEKRLGSIDLVIDARLNPVSQQIELDFSEEISSAPLLHMPGTVSKQRDTAGNISVYGVTNEFKNFFDDLPAIKKDSAWVSKNIADKLSLNAGDDIVLRIRNNSLLPGDLPLTGSADNQTAIRLKAAILPATSLSSRFSLHPSQLPPLNIFVNLEQLQTSSNMTGLINLIVMKDRKLAESQELLKKLWKPEHSGLVLKTVDSGTSLELVSNRVFLPREIVGQSSGTPIISYMANSMSAVNSKLDSIPYSIISALDHSPESGKIYKKMPNLKDGEVILNKWAADDIGASTGDKVSLTYYVDSSDGKLKEETTVFTVKEILEVEDFDRDLMPAFPGIADEEHCRDWEPGIPMDMSRIRDKDEKYWEKYKGTPKAIINYSRGKELWGNRYGETTSLRWPVAKGRENIIAELKQSGPEASGLYLRDIRQEADSAASNGIDFGMLFASMSFFLIAAALILSALLHAFQLEERKFEMGIMLSAGFTVKEVKRRFLFEGVILSMLAVIPGIPLGILYTSQVLNFLSSIWIDAVGTSDIKLHTSAAGITAGTLTYIIIAAGVLSIVNRQFLKKTPVELLQGDREISFKAPKFIVAKLGMLFAVAATICLFALSENQFVLTSTLLLAAVLCFSHGFLEKMKAKTRIITTMSGLSMRNLARRNSRSLGAILLMTCGTYIVLFVASRQKELNFSPDDNSSGTGGFEYMVQTSIPLRYKPDSTEAVNEFGTNKKILNNSEIASVRYHRGDDASCLNLNKAQAPSIYGINVNDFNMRFTLKNGNWASLQTPLEKGIIPVIGDENTVLWGLQLYGGTGSIMTVNDEKGRKVKVQIVAMLKSSMLQGALIMDRSHFDRLYPSESGYSLFLIDDKTVDGKIIKELKDVYLDYGPVIEKSLERLKNFLKIEATYLVIFQMLGGLGLILGAVGFGFLILRNVQDRESELATMRAIGFSKRDIFNSLLHEHLILLLWSVSAGVICALVCWIPLMVTKTELPFTRILTILVLIISAGAVSCLVSAGYSLKSGFYQILKSE